VACATDDAPSVRLESRGPLRAVPAPWPLKEPVMTTASHKSVTVLDRVRECLARNEPQKGLDALNHCQDHSPQADNARAVCLMRLGRPEAAVALYRKLLLSSGVLMRQDAPAQFKSNFAAALLMTGNLSGATALLDELRGTDDPGARRLRDALGRWRRSLSPWRRGLAAIGIPPQGPIALDYAPGEL